MTNIRVSAQVQAARNCAKGIPVTGLPMDDIPASLLQCQAAITHLASAIEHLAREVVDLRSEIEKG